LAQIVYSRKAFSDLERLADFLMQTAPAAAAETVGLITEAVSVLRRHPYLGRAIDSGLHELVISRGHSGYIALYRVERMDDAVLILSIRHQREAGFNAGEIV
jgi:plasmid stabilization system protein ParE